MPSLFEQNPPQIMMCILQKAEHSSDGYERDRKLRNGKIIFEKIKLLFGHDPLDYVNGSESLPPPLKPSEEQEAFRLLEKNPKAAREKLITHNLRLVVYISKKFESTGIGIEDLVSIGTIGLIKAVNTFNPEKNIKLADMIITG